MTKTYKIEGIDCAVCAAKLEAKIRKVKGVESASVSFLSEKLILTVSDDGAEEIIAKVMKLIRKEEPDSEVTER